MNKLFTPFLLVAFALIVFVILAFMAGCSDDDDDDDSDPCWTCVLTAECKASLGRGWVCEADPGQSMGCCILADTDDDDEELLIYEEELQNIIDAGDLVWEVCKWDNVCCLCDTDEHCSDIYDEPARCVQWCCEWPETAPVHDLAL